MTCFPPSFIFVVVSLIGNFLGFAGEGERVYLRENSSLREAYFWQFLGD